MISQLPDHSVLYRALVARDPSYEGRAYVAVKTTGIFCRLTCPARKPKPQNCRFFATTAECVTAGFRPCKRCSPEAPAAEGNPLIQALVDAMRVNPERQWSESDLESLGFDPSTVRRVFKRHFGMTFLEMARRSRLRDGVETLAVGGKVIDAQLDAGFSSPSAFSRAFARLLGTSPASFVRDAPLRADWIDTPLGPMVAVSSVDALHLLEFADRRALPTELKRLRKTVCDAIGLGRFAPTDQVERELESYFAGRSADFTVSVVLHGTPFTQQVWHALREIPAGETRSYSEIAVGIGRPSARRAVARANGANQLAIVIPCHRVIGADGSLVGYGGGLHRKQKLIEIERAFA